MRSDNRLGLLRVAQRWSDRLPPRWGRRVRDIGKIALDYRGQRRTAFRHVQYELVRRASPVLAAPFGQGQLLVDSRDDEIGRTVYVSGGYERWHMEAAVAQLRASGRDPTGTVFVDVGANIGTSTVDALVQYGFERAICFEPAPDNVRLLRINLTWNDLHDRAEVYGVAVSDRDGFGSLARSPDNSGDHRFAVADEGPDACRTLDSFVHAGAIEPSTVGLLWIDAQGHEPHVLRGATEILNAGVPVVLEYCPWVLGAGIGDLDDLILRHFGTIINLDDESRVQPADLADLARRFARRGYADLLLLPAT